MVFAPIIILPNRRMSFEVMWDASGVALGVKFRSYLLGTRVVVHTDHSALRYLMAKKDAKSRSICWVLILQEFDFEVIDRKGIKNHVNDHVSGLEDEAMRELGDKNEIDDTFPDEHVLAFSQYLIPWFTDFANCVASNIIPPDLYRSCVEGLMQCSVPEVQMLCVLEACHPSPVGRNHNGIRTAHQILQCGYYWPTIYQDAHEFAKACDRCQRDGAI
ncbi:uncharacterized protein [Solanum lycopersicum]|uniref:uncharacterized protein n=1 Tax=Solanum lycopersicum TaxID=4081 RepID=UPI003748A2A5